MGASQGPVQGCAKVLQDRGQVPRALREALVVIQELPDPLLRLVLDTNADGRPGPVEGVLQERGQDPFVDVLHIRRGPQAVVHVHKDQVWVNLLGLQVHDVVGQGLLDSLGQLFIFLGPPGRQPQGH